jgi:integrase
MTLGSAVSAYLESLHSKGTKRQYASILGRLSDAIGQATALDSVSPDGLAGHFGRLWDGRAPATWNLALDAVRSACRYWADQGWLTSDPTVRLRRRPAPPDRTRALSRDEIQRLLASDKYPLRDRALWRLLYESAARSAEVLRLNVQDLDMANKRAKVRRKGGASDTIVWQTGTQVLLRRYLKGRTSGPLFVTERKAKVPLPPADLDEHGRARLSYRQAEDIFRAASGGATLHQLRHSALTHEAEDGTSTNMLMTKSGHTSIRTLTKYARPSAEALQRHQEANDPARRG